MNTRRLVPAAVLALLGGCGGETGNEADTEPGNGVSACELVSAEDASQLVGGPVSNVADMDSLCGWAPQGKQMSYLNVSLDEGELPASAPEGIELVQVPGIGEGAVAMVRENRVIELFVVQGGVVLRLNTPFLEIRPDKESFETLKSVARRAAGRM